MKAVSNAKRLNETMQGSLEKLSSGSRIVRAADDAATLAISEKLRANIRSTGQTIRIANDAISILQTVESNLGTISDMAVRMRELSVQAASDTLGSEEKQMANTEFQQLKEEIHRILNISMHNNRSTVSGTTEVLMSQLIDRSPGAMEFRLSGGVGEQGQSVKYRPSQLFLSKDDFDLSSKNISTTNGARDSLSELDRVIMKVSESRASVGSLQSQLHHASNVNEVGLENTSASNSRMRDLDYAQETANNIKTKIQTDTNLAVQVQANAAPQALLKLIG